MAAIFPYAISKKRGEDYYLNSHFCVCVCVLKLIDDDATTTRAQNVIKREATDELHSTERCQNIQLVSRFVSSPLLLLFPFYVRTSTTTHIHRYCSSLALSDDDDDDDDAGYTQVLYPPRCEQCAYGKRKARGPFNWKFQRTHLLSVSPFVNCK